MEIKSPESVYSGISPEGSSKIIFNLLIVGGTGSNFMRMGIVMQ